MSIGKKMKIARGDLKIIPQYETWLYKHSRDLHEHHRIMGEIFDRPARVRTGSFSASGAGRCLRERSFGHLLSKDLWDEKPDPKTMNIFVNGDFVHLRHQIAGIQMGYFTAAEVSVANEEWWLTGTMDAVMDDGGIGEIKSINDNGFRTVTSFGSKTEHVEQVHSYMLCSGKDSARILYENKNTNELKEFLVNRDEKIIDKVKEDLKTLIEYVQQLRPVPVVKANCPNRRCVACQISDAAFALLTHEMAARVLRQGAKPSIRIKRNSPGDW